ncbi:50S ribosomal protein L19e [uncultured archaeon]|nr:50S ribosomal protein L19e [uncultured archaeon]
MNLASQKRLASELLKAGVNRIRFDVEKLDEISEAITRDDVRALIKDGSIYAAPARSISRGRVRERAGRKASGRYKGSAKRTGTQKARKQPKSAWMQKIRALREELRKMKAEGEIDANTYRSMYLQAKGNLFHSRRHLREQHARTKE